MALQIRQNAAINQNTLPPGDRSTNGDEALYPNLIATFTKGFPHNGLGEVDLSVYSGLLYALSTGRHADFEKILIGDGRKLRNPQAAFTYGMEGADSHTFSLPPPPAFSSANAAADMVELYWQAIARDVPFAEYDSSPIIQSACAELTQLSDYRGPRDGNGQVTPANVFRGFTPSDLKGPYLSQYLLKPFPISSTLIDQKYRTGMPGVDYMTAYSEWLQVQQGLPDFREDMYDPMPRYIRSGRDLAHYVHYDHPYQAALHAALIILDLRPETLLNFNTYQFSDTNPYKKSRIQCGFVTFNVSHATDWLARVTSLAFKAAWYQKWCVNRRLRPEAFGGRVYNTLTGAASYPIHPDLLNSQAVQAAVQTTGASLLPQAYVEGSPCHPSYPAAHGVVSAAGATVLKALFDETALVSGCVAPSADGLSLVPADGLGLTIGDELNKLAFNIPMGRDWSGIHYRSDVAAAMALGEAVAISFIQDQVNCFSEDFGGFHFTSFAGNRIDIVPSQ